MGISKVSLSERYKNDDHNKKRFPASGVFDLLIQVGDAQPVEKKIAATEMIKLEDYFFMQAIEPDEGGLLEFRGDQLEQGRTYEIFPDNSGKIEAWFRWGELAAIPYLDPTGTMTATYVSSDGKEVNGYFDFRYTDQKHREIFVNCKSFRIRHA